MSEFERVEAYLPDVVKEMVELIGITKTEQVIKHFGGVEFYFSAGKTYYPRLVKVIGEESALKVRQYFNRERLYIPRCDTALRVLRNERFKAEFATLKKEQNLSSNLAMVELCPKYGFSERYAWKILQMNAGGLKPAQASLF